MAADILFPGYPKLSEALDSDYPLLPDESKIDLFKRVRAFALSLIGSVFPKDGPKLVINTPYYYGTGIFVYDISEIDRINVIKAAWDVEDSGISNALLAKYASEFLADYSLAR